MPGDLRSHGPRAGSRPLRRPRRLDRPLIVPEGLTLAALIERLGAGVARFDESFARTVALALQQRAGHVRFPAVDRLRLGDVIATLYMDQRLRLVVTGHLRDDPAGGQVTISWREDAFDDLAVTLTPASAATDGDAYTFATLDFSVRGRQGTLTQAAPPLPAGQRVRVRALATIGGLLEYRVQALGVDVSVPTHALDLD